MNSRLHRIVFNRHRGTLMVAAENARSLAGGSPGTRRSAGTSHTGGFALRIGILTLAIQAGFTTSAQAQVVPYRDAPAARQPAIGSAANGVPLVNITRPSSAGVSRNEYSRFDVDPQGLILNNSRSDTSTQLGGWVEGNPQLSGGTARIIVNEVVSPDPSQLSGYVEIAGRSAQVVIANPSGITCDGCGFINANRATLTTGTPQYDNGSLRGYQVQTGTVRIEGAGLDARQVTHTEIIANAVEVNAGIWARQLHVTAGAAMIDAQTASHTAPLEGEHAGTAPAVAIDVAELGGMYANSIRLIGTDAGVGVRNAGHIGASAGELVVTADGRLENTGNLVASGHLTLKTDAGLHNRGQVLSLQTVTVSAATAADNTGGRIAAGQHASLNAQDLINLGGTVESTGSIEINASRHLDNRSGLIQANGNILVSARNIDNSDTLAPSIGIHGHSVTVSGEGLDNQRGQLTARSRLDLEADHIANSGVIDADALRIEAGTIDNHGQGRIFATTVAIDAQTLHNRGEAGDAPVIAARADMDLGVATLSNRDNALILSLGDMRIAGELDHDHRAVGSADSVTNASAAIEAGGHLRITADTLTNTDTHFQTAAVQVERQRIEEYQHYSSTRRFAEDEVSIRLGRPNSDQWVLYLNTPDGRRSNDYFHYNYTRTVTETQVMARAPASIQSFGTLNIEADTVINDKSRILAGGVLAIVADDIFNLDATGQRIERDTGTATRYYRIKRSQGGMVQAQGVDQRSYAPAPVVETIALANAESAGNQTISLEASSTLPSAADASTPAATPLTPNALFGVQPGPTALYLIETDPRFADFRHWISSDYMLDRLGLDPALVQKRLGDGFYEQRLLNEQIAQLTGRRFLEGHAEQEAQYRALMDAGIAFAETWQLVPGVELSPGQMAALTTDIVWLVETSVTLADGSTHSVLAPRLYARTPQGDLSPSGSLLAGAQVQLDSAGTLFNQGAIAGRQLVSISADTIANLGGTVSGNQVVLHADNDIIAAGGRIAADNGLNLAAGRDMVLSAATYRTEADNGVRSGIAQTLQIDNAAGDMTLLAGRDLRLAAVHLANTGDGDTLLAAGRDLALDIVREERAELLTHTRSERLETETRDQGSRIEVGGNLALFAGNDLAARATSINAAGDFTAAAGANIDITAGVHAQGIDGRLTDMNSGRVSRLDVSRERAIASELRAADITLAAGGDLTVAGSDLTSNEALRLAAGGDLTLGTAAEHDRRDWQRRDGRNWRLESSTSERVTTLSAGGDIDIVAGHDLLLRGTAIRTPGDAQLAAQGDIVLEAAYDTYSLDARSYRKSSGLFSSNKRTSREIAERATPTGVDIQAGNIDIAAGGDLSATAARLISHADTTLSAGGELELLAALNTDAYSFERNRSGDFGRRSQRSALDHSIEHVGTTIAAGGDIAIDSGSNQTWQAASLSAGGAIDIRAGGTIDFEGVKDFEQHARHKSSSDWAWRKAKGEGYSQETLRLTEIAATSGLVIEAAERIRIDVPRVTAESVADTIARLAAAEPQLAWLADMHASGDIDWRQVREHHDRFKYSDSGMGPGLALAVAIVTTVATGGWGNAIAAQVGTTYGPAAGYAAQAAFHAAASNLAIQTINARGDLGRALSESLSGDALKSYASAALTAKYIDAYFGAGTDPITGTTLGHDLNTVAGTARFAAHQGARAVLSATVDTALHGGSLEDRLAAALTQQAIHVVSATAFNQVGNLGLADGSLEKILVKALVGGAISQAATGDFASGALAAGANEALVTQLAQLSGNDPTLLVLASRLVGTVSAALSGGDPAQAADIAGYGTQYNFLTHREQQLLKEAEMACLLEANANACAVAGQLDLLDRQRDEQLAEALEHLRGEQAWELAIDLRARMPDVCAAPFDCTANVHWNTVAGFQHQAMQSAQGIGQAALFEWLLLGPLNSTVAGTAASLQALRPGMAFLVNGSRLGAQGALVWDPLLGAGWDLWQHDVALSDALLARYANITPTDVAIAVTGGAIINRAFGLPMHQWSGTALNASRWSGPEAFVIQMNQDALNRSFTSIFTSAPDYTEARP